MVLAVRAGVPCVLPRQASPEVLRRAVAAAIDGQAVLPVSVVAGLAAGAGLPAGSVPSDDKLAWLRALAAGVTVAQLAEQVGYSERAMFRLLKSLYRDLGVS